MSETEKRGLFGRLFGGKSARPAPVVRTTPVRPGH